MRDVVSILNTPMPGLWKKPQFPSTFWDSYPQYWEDWQIGESDGSVSFDIPGVQKKDINIKVKENYLTVEASNDKRKYLFETKVPKCLDAGNISAELADGVLTLKANIRKESIPVKIEVK
jgi:HSP20 family molecular chaperone IbpA